MRALEVGEWMASCVEYGPVGVGILGGGHVDGSG